MLRRVGEAVLKVLGVFVILEPIWMLLPFAGFLYGSVFRIQTLSRDPATAWLTHFVFPVLTLGWLGPALVLAGLLLFVVGAVQIYGAKIAKRGLVTGGMYRFVRHPQYTALTLFGLGLILAWGRAVAYVAFFAMMLLYYYLAKVEERRCVEAFGDEYRRYRDRTSLVLPGDVALRRILPRLPGSRLPAPVRALIAIVLVTAACFGSMRLIDAVKRAVRTVPLLTAELKLEGGAVEPPAGLRAGVAAGVPFVTDGRVAVVRGPYRNAAAPGFAERVLLRLGRSEALRDVLSFQETDERAALVAFGIPFEPPATPGRPPEGDPDRRGPPVDPAGPERVRLILFRCRLAAGAGIADAFEDAAKRELLGAWFAPVNLGRPAGEDLVEGRVFRPGPRFPAEERWAFLTKGTAAHPAPAGAGAAAVPGLAESATLVMVKAPILRTRRDPAFAREILDRLVASAALRTHLGNSGAGDGTVAVAFPRPGPNWYREHHGTPQISVFVMLVRPAGEGAHVDALFRPDGRDLAGAFIVDLDFGIAQPADSVTAISTVGPRRDLEERWTFFLSGL